MKPYSVGCRPEEEAPDLGTAAAAAAAPEPDAELNDLDPALAAIVQRHIAAERKRMEKEFATSKTTLMAHQKMVRQPVSCRAIHQRTTLVLWC